MGCDYNINQFLSFGQTASPKTDNEKWSYETQENFKKECQTVKVNNKKSCDCIMRAFMEKYDEASFKMHSLNLSQREKDSDFINIWAEIIMECEQ